MERTEVAGPSLAHVRSGDAKAFWGRCKLELQLLTAADTGCQSFCHCVWSCWLLHFTFAAKMFSERCRSFNNISATLAQNAHIRQFQLPHANFWEFICWKSYTQRLSALHATSQLFSHETSVTSHLFATNCTCAQKPGCMSFLLSRKRHNVLTDERLGITWNHL